MANSRIQASQDLKSFDLHPILYLYDSIVADLNPAAGPIVEMDGYCCARGEGPDKEHLLAPFHTLDSIDRMHRKPRNLIVAYSLTGTEEPRSFDHAREDVCS